MGEENKDIRKENLEGGCCYSGDDRNDSSWKKAYFDLCNQLRGVEESNSKLLHKNAILNNAKAGLIEANHGLQSKVAKQANEIKRLTEELAIAQSFKRDIDKLRDAYNKLAVENMALKEQSQIDLAVKKDLEKRLDKARADYATLSEALDQASKDAENNFERGKFKGAEELWSSIQWAQDRLKHGGLLFPVYGYYGMAACVDNLTATAFLRRTLDWQEKEAHDIKIGDEVVVISSMGSYDLDYGIVYNIIERDGSKSYHIIGSGNCMAFGDRAIADGSVRKTGKHYDHVPFDYLA